MEQNLEVQIPESEADVERKAKAKKALLCRLLATCTILLWSTAFVLTRMALLSYSDTAIASLRCLAASVVLAVAAVILKIGLPQKKDIPLFFVSGAAGFGIYMVIFSIGMKTISSATGSLIIATGPIITALLATFFFKEKISAKGWGAIALAFSGIVILTLWDGVLSVNSGVLWVFAGACLVGVYNVTQRMFTRKYSAFQTICYSIWAGTILLIPFLPGSFPQISTAELTHTGIVLFLGVCSTALAYGLWTKALSLAETTSHVTVFMFVTPFLATLWGYILMSEALTPATLAGGAIIIAGLVLFHNSKKQ